MIYFRYCSKRIDPLSSATEALLNTYGGKGWEALGVTVNPMNRTIVWFKRGLDLRKTTDKIDLKKKPPTFPESPYTIIIQDGNNQWFASDALGTISMGPYATQILAEAAI